MSDKLNTLEALRLASLKAKGYTAEQIAELSSAMEDIINDINDSLKTCEAHVQSAHAPANAEENVIVSIQRNGQAIPPDNKVVNIEVPTKTSALENDSGYATTEDVEEKVNGHESNINDLLARVKLLELILSADVTGNPYYVTFNTLTDVVVSSGIWNEADGRIEF